MMKCPKCDSLVENDAASCWNCFAEFRPSSGHDDVALAAARVRPRRRPDGTALLVLGIGLLVLAGLFFLIAVAGGENDLDAMARRATLILLAGGAFQLGLVLALAGAVVRAIWFLPGEEEKMPPLPAGMADRPETNPRP